MSFKNMITSAAIPRDFPSLENRVYLNTAAEGIPPLQVGEALQSYWRDKLTGMDGRALHFEQEVFAKEVAARMVRLRPEDVSFCSCSAEAYNLLAGALRLSAEDEVIISDLDFPSGATPWITAVEQPAVRLWNSRNGRLDLGDLSALLNKKTRLVQISLVSFYNGYRVPWQPFLDQVRRKSPHALVSVDITQALGRCVLDCAGADILISSTHKWTLGIHGGCIVAVAPGSAERLTTRAGGWYHLKNAFDSDRFEKADIRPGAASFSVGMPSFAPIYAINASLRYLETIGVERIARHADFLTDILHGSLREMGLPVLAPHDPSCCSGIVAFRHEKVEEIHRQLRERNIHVMHHAGRLRVSLHGYNTIDDVRQFLEVLGAILKS